MMRSFSAAVSGLRTHQAYLDAVSNDIANVNTMAYKSSRFSFKDAFNQTLKNSGGAGTVLGSVNGQQVGLGVEVGSIDNQMGQGPITTTGNPFDMAIQGDGFFRVGKPKENPESGIEYTRAGNFTTTETGDIVNQDGYYLIGWAVAPNSTAKTLVNGQPVPGIINIPTSARSVNIDQNGLVAYITGADILDTTTYPDPTDPHNDPTNALYDPLVKTGETAYAGYVTMAKFPNPQGLERVSGNLWQASQSSGTAMVDTATQNGIGSIVSRALEGSNVDISFEFAEMIKAQRGFQVNSRTISTADDMLQTLVSMKR